MESWDDIRGEGQLALVVGLSRLLSGLRDRAVSALAGQLIHLYHLFLTKLLALCIWHAASVLSDNRCIMTGIQMQSRPRTRMNGSIVG